MIRAVRVVARDCAERAAEAVRANWKARGFVVDVTIEPEHDDYGRVTVYQLKSSTLNGWPHPVIRLPI